MEQAAEDESIGVPSDELSLEFKTLMNTDDLNFLDNLQHLMSMKSKNFATYPDAFQDESAIEALDRRPDLEMPQ